MTTPRRRFIRDGSLWLASAALWGCKAEQAPATAAAGDPAADPGRAPAPGPPGGSSIAAPTSAAPGPSTCDVTPDNIEGPYYREGAPMRSDLTDRTTPGTRLVVRGRVTDHGCRPVSGALLDVWQADRDGRYDNDGHAGDKLVLRGKIAAAPDGTFEFRTIIPGRYLNGAQYRPAHVHVKISAAGFAPLTTQLYFDGDPYNGIDPFIKSPLVMHLGDEAGAKAARYDFALRGA